MTAPSWYELELDGRRYVGHKDGRPFTLPELWQELEGVAGARIIAPGGRVVLENAGSLSARARLVARARARNGRARSRRRWGMAA